MYPVIGPSGAPLTRTYPIENKEDHPHHSSLWFAHGSVNGTDFWLDGEKAGTIKHTGFGEVKAAGSTGSFVARSQWVKPNGSEVPSHADTGKQGFVLGDVVGGWKAETEGVLEL